MDQCKSTLTAPRQRLLQTMQQLYFGNITGLVIKGGEPCFSPAPAITQEVKLGSESTDHKAPTNDNFTLKRHAVDLFAQFDRLPDGIAVNITVRHGLPALLTIPR